MRHRDRSLPLSRRQALGRIGAGCGTLGLAALLAEEQLLAAPGAASAGGIRGPHFAPRAKHLIQLFMPGGPSQVDTFDYKPAIKQYEGQRPAIVDRKSIRNTKNGLYPSPFSFQQYGECGKWVSDIFPHVAQHVDDMCFVHSMHTDLPEHAGASLMMCVGHLQPTRPSLGSWLIYGLGSENQNLPGFVAMSPRAQPRPGTANWASSFLPGSNAGCYVNVHKMRPESVLDDLRSQYASPADQQQQVDLLAWLNRQHAERQRHEAALEARIAAMEMAFRMQASVPEAFDTAGETQATLDLYGPGEFAKGCLLARRLVERGVRVVQLSLTTEGMGVLDDVPWDTGHNDIQRGHSELARQCDQAIAGLIVDLKQRGLFEETLLVWGGEFGRTPTSEGQKGRDHDHYGYTSWLAGGGVKGGLSYGATDEFGLSAVENRVHVHDLHATILHLMGLDHERLTYRYSGRDYRLTDVHGHVVRDILA